MKSLFGWILMMTFLWGCGSPPSQPDSLWDSLPSSQDSGGAKEVPAKVWEEEPVEAEGSEDAGEQETESVPEGQPETTEVTGTVVLNEIYYDAVGSDTDGLLFVELYGTPGLLIGSAMVAFVDGGDGSVDDTITLPEDARIPADGFYVIADARTGMATETMVSGADLIDNFDPQNGPDAVQLIDKDGNLLDAVAYGEGVVPAAENGLATGEGGAAPDVVNGHSLERQGPGVDLGDNLKDFVDRETPTPGTQSSLDT